VATNAESASYSSDRPSEQKASRSTNQCASSSVSHDAIEPTPAVNCINFF
jgi:hypothetical protein